ncbi:metallophosphoesterase [Roseomonas sp. SSH11]|uniref:Metallophosphoesterase n=1 Tax=Pararoseomonas baculiformis TaxID=2820812 RepID=A0ABS4AFJ7_9PROT|nr:metallophosphoesterase [Pararoseomonas baculiformis]MBP0445300.1 metallophosphoesterase [Pararoseomonas baculiformis]
MAFRLAQISDTHLSARVPAFSANFDHLAEHLRGLRPDLVINTGDLSLDGADQDEDLALARSAHDGLGLDWLAVPGNHDVGDDPLPGCRQPANAERLARWRRHIGQNMFVQDVPGWRLIGLDSQITATTLPDAEAQMEALVRALEGAAGRALAIFLHKPLCQERMDEMESTYWCVQSTPRHRILDLLMPQRPAFVASGHVHQWRDRGVSEGLRQIWAPSAAFIVGDAYQEAVGEKQLGYVEHALHADGSFESRLVTLPGLVLHDIGEMPEVYGPQRRLAA